MRLFPHTCVIEPDGVVLTDGEHVTLEEFCTRSKKQRSYYIKYAGTDVAINWGSKGVYLASTLSGTRCRKLMEQILTDRERGRCWVLQEAVRHSEPVVAFGRDDELVEIDASSKISSCAGSLKL